MAKVDSGIVRYFIRSKAFRGPESHYLKQGQFAVGLIEPSNPPSDTNLDKVLCWNALNRDEQIRTKPSVPMFKSIEELHEIFSNFDMHQEIYIHFCRSNPRNATFLLALKVFGKMLMLISWASGMV